MRQPDNSFQFKDFNSPLLNPAKSLNRKVRRVPEFRDRCFKTTIRGFLSAIDRLRPKLRVRFRPGADTSTFNFFAASRSAGQAYGVCAGCLNNCIWGPRTPVAEINGFVQIVSVLCHKSTPHAGFGSLSFPATNARYSHTHHMFDNTDPSIAPDLNASQGWGCAREFPRGETR